MPNTKLDDITAEEMDLFELGKYYFNAFLKEFASYNIQANPKMELRRGTGILCYYDLKDGHVYLSTPDLKSPSGKLHMLFLRSILGCKTNEDLFYFFKLFMPHVISHEMAHHFRSRYGLFGANLWHEEHVANQLAISVTKNRYPPPKIEKALEFLNYTIHHLEKKLEIHNIAIDSYYTIWQSLNTTGQIGNAALGYMELAYKLFAIDPADMLQSSGHLSEEIIERLERREDIIDEINTQYASDYMRYLYYQLSWLYLDLTSHENQYVEAFARLHLNISVPMLPLISEATEVSEEAIVACFKAYQDTLPYSEASSNYFYKRYRSLLLTKLQSPEYSLPGQTDRLKKEARFLLQNWDGREEEADMLNYLSNLAHPSLRRLFPHQIIDNIEGQFPIQVHLPTGTDKRLWRHIVLQEYDQGAINTLARLNILNQIELYRSLPAEVILELTHNFCRVKLDPGETIIWQNAINNDVYILIEGELEVFITRQNGEKKHLAYINPGEVFGEMAFFTREPRNATVRATKHAECFALKDSDLHIFAFKYPSVLMQMARTLTKRLEINQNALSSDGKPIYSMTIIDRKERVAS